MKCKKKLLAFFALILPFVLQGCDYALFAPKGPVGEGIKTTLFITVFAMLIVVIPTLIMIVYFAYRYSYKRKNIDETYKPNWDHSSKIEFWAWGVPIVIVIFLASVTYWATHRLDPQKPLSDEKPLVIDVIAFNYKWFFIYPEEKIATINEIYIPVNKPVEFHVTADATINSFYIPRLGSQIYAMPGMNLKLNLMASEKGVYEGTSANYSGYGFTTMKFKAHAVDNNDYNQWVMNIKENGNQINMATFKEWHVIGKQFEVYPNAPEQPAYFNNVDPGLFTQFIGFINGVTK